MGTVRSLAGVSGQGASGEVDYAVPATVGSGRRRPRRAPGTASPLWGGPWRRALVVGCWGLALLLAAVLVVPLVSPEPEGADSPEAAVERLLQGIADLDPVAVLAAVDPVETDDPDRARAAYDRLSGRLARDGEVPPAAVTAAVTVTQGQVGGADLGLASRLAAVDLDLDGLVLARVPTPASSGLALVALRGGELDVRVDPVRLPSGVTGAGREPASYTMPMSEGWRRDRTTPVDAVLAAVERDGGWFVSLESSAAYLLDERVLRPRP